MNETRKYSRDSFSRFGDDLSEELLSYVSLSDCFAFEFISKQFQRSVFGGQKMLDTERDDFNSLRAKLSLKLNTDIEERIFNITLKKCLFVNEIIIDRKYNNNDSIIEIICNNCSNLSSISLNGYINLISPKTWQLFGEKFGHSLRSISFNGSEKSFQTLLRLTPNLIEGEIYDLNDMIFETEEREHVLPKLKKITVISNADIDFSSFVDMYSNRVETIILRNQCNVNNPRLMFEQLSRFQNLEVLHIESINLRYCDDIDTAFNLIAMNCQKLRELSLVSDSAIFNRIDHRFLSLKRLTLQLKSHVSFKRLNVSDFSCCSNLTELKLILLGANLDGDHFSDIHLHLPKLQCIELKCRIITYKFVQSLTFLRDLYYIKFTANMVTLTDKGLRYVISRCPSIRKINFTSVSNISPQTVYMFIMRAISLPKHHNYELKVQVLKLDSSIDTTNAIIRNLPKNIRVDITVKPIYQKPNRRPFIPTIRVQSQLLMAFEDFDLTGFHLNLNTN